MIRRMLETLKGTYLFMIAFGLMMGVVFPFYSALFFGKGAFNPLYVAGCLVAGFLVGSFCFLIIKQVLGRSIERQYQALGAIVSLDSLPARDGGTDQLQASMAILQGLLRRIEQLLQRVTGAIGSISPRCQQLAASARTLTEGNSHQVTQVRETVAATSEMNAAFDRILAEVDALSAVTEERTAITSEMSSSISSIADTVERYNRSVETTATAVRDIARDLEQITGQVDSLSEATEGTASAVTEISASIGEVRDHAATAADASATVLSEAQQGMKAMHSLIGSMHDIDEASRSSVAAIGRLTDHSGRIGSVIDIITDIVEQTNLLSLNASIIAAQAGSRGRAFAVVAEEIRSLAQRTASSTREISTLVEDIQCDTGEMSTMINRGRELAIGGMAASEKTRSALERIAAKAEDAAARVGRIADATAEQASGSTGIAQTAEENMSRFNQVRHSIRGQEERVQEIGASLTEMGDLSRQIARSTREQARANQQLLQGVVADSERARELKETADTQRVLGLQVGGFLDAAQNLIMTNAAGAKSILTEVEGIATLTAEVQRDLDAFSAAGADSVTRVEELIDDAEIYAPELLSSRTTAAATRSL